MRYRVWFAAVAVVLLICVYSYADVPKMINFQGRLTDASGKFVTDGNYSLTFKIYTDSTGGSSKWSETKSVTVSKGLFNAILGSQTPIPDSIFNHTNTWLGIQVGADPEMTPRQRLSSLGYSYYSLNSDKLDGLHASDFSGVGSDYGRSGVATDLYEGPTILSNKYVNVIGPDSVYSTSGTAFSGKASGVSGFSNLVGVHGYAENTSTGEAYGGDFQTSSSGTGFHTGVRGRGYGGSTADIYGSAGYADNTSTGAAYGGYFSATASGTGMHTGVRGRGYGASSSETYGASGYASNSSTGEAFGGDFETSSSGIGFHTGVRGRGYGASAADIYGSAGYADNTSTGAAYGGYFSATASGTGVHTGVRGRGYSSSSSVAYGASGYASNSSTGDAYGGFFSTSTSGTGVHYGLKAESYGASSSPVHGLNGRGENTSSGAVYAGLFTAASSGTGTHYGIYSASTGSSGNGTYGVYGTAGNTSTGDIYGGYFSASGSGTGFRYGVAANSYSNQYANPYGIYGNAESTTPVSAYGGYFSGTTASGGYGYGVFASGSDWAGYFYGNVHVSLDFYVSGSKNAAVKIDNGEYRTLSCQESPEVWFEDFGEGQLVNGKTHIELDPLFLQTVTINAQHPMKVFVQLEGDCNGVYVSKGTTGFDVNELKTGTSNASFSYRIVAKRKGYEDRRLAKFKGPTPEEIVAQSAKIKADMEKERIKREQENQAVTSEK